MVTQEKKRIRGYCPCGAPKTSHKATRCRACFHKDIAVSPDQQKEYRRNWAIKKKYGLDPIEVDALWLAARGRCQICDKQMLQPTPTRGQGLDVMAIDHDHKTGNLRGLLCNGCNKATGLFKDDTRLLEKAIKYLNYGKSS